MLFTSPNADHSRATIAEFTMNTGTQREALAYAGDGGFDAEGLGENTTSALNATWRRMSQQDQTLIDLVKVLKDERAANHSVAPPDSSARRRINPPEPFKGEDWEDWDSYKEICEDFKKTDKLEGEVARIWLTTRLAKKAAKALNTTPKEERDTWDKIMAILDERFSSTKRRKGYFRTQFETATQNKNESSDDFIDRVQGYRVKAEPKETKEQRLREVQRKVVSRLRESKLRTMVKAKLDDDEAWEDTPWSMEKFRKCVRKMEDSWEEQKTWEAHQRSETREKYETHRGENVRDKIHHITESCGACALEHPTPECPFLRLTEMTEGNQPPEHITDEDETDWWTRTIRAMAPKDMSQVKCFKCGELGHYARDCSSEKQTGLNEIERKFELNQKHSGVNDNSRRMWREYFKMMDEVKKRFPDQFKNDRRWATNQQNRGEKPKGPNQVALVQEVPEAKKALNE